MEFNSNNLISYLTQLIVKGLVIMKKRIIQLLLMWREARVSYRNRYMRHRLGS
ncbi:hypothetical protein POAR111328_04125 [Polynucleobacter arcticus]